jgi:SPX domain protein involved in polyphosphate accumulation
VKGDSMYQSIFSRVEKKYLLTEDQYVTLLKKIQDKIKKDKNYHSTICNVYLDTKEYDLVKASIQKPIYKEKFRIRSYNVPELEDDVFFEIKKKYNGVVSKRRIKINLRKLYEYLHSRNI